MKLSHRLLVLLAIAALLFPHWYSPTPAQAAAVGNAYAERATELTHTGDTNWTDVVTIASSSFVGDGVYFVIAAGDFGSTDDGAATAEVRLVHGTTPTAFTGSFHTFESMDGSTGARQYLYGPYVTEFTQPGTAEDVKVQMRVNNGAETVRATSVTIWAIRRDVDLTEDTDFKYAENSTTTEHTTSMVARASITWTPADNNDEWVVIGSQQTLVDSFGVNFEVQIDRDSGTETVGLYSREGEDTNEQMVLGTFWPFTLTAAEHTLAIHSRDDQTGVNDHAYSAILALRLDAFEDHTATSTTATIDAFGNDTWGEIGWMDITPQTAGDIVLMARASTKEIADRDEANIRIQIGGTSLLGDKDADWSTVSVDADDKSPQFTLALENVAASAQDVDIDGKMHEGQAGEQDMHDRAGVVFSMELAAADEPPAAPAERRRPVLITEGWLRPGQMAA